MTLKQLWKIQGFENAADLAEHVRTTKTNMTAENLEALNNGDLDAVTLRGAVEVAEALFISFDELLKLATKKRPTRFKNMARLRKARGMDESQAAEIIETTAGVFVAKERGAVGFTASEITILGAALKVDPAVLLPE